MASLCQEGVEPSGLKRKVSDYVIVFPLSQPYPVANALDSTGDAFLQLSPPVIFRGD